MRHAVVLSLLGIASLIATGCGKPAADSPTASSAGGSTTTASAAGTTVAATGGDPTAAPVAAAQKFLNAVRRGQTDQAAAMLTPLALQMTTQSGFYFLPPASDTLQFSIVAADMVEADKAVVETVWSDLDADGQRTEETIAWALRLHEGQWRISGMAAEGDESEPLVVIDFENPQDLMDPAGSPTPTTTNASPQPANPADQVARDPFQQPATR
ncbi:MAG: hypothetical protein KDA44_14830 [Planctomycetales bacterium]|nr:hypothetical protein [Planctomycetales bacterium]